jgi:DNA replication protein DnaC
MNASLGAALKKLRLSGLLQTLDIRLQEAASHGLSHAEFLELLVQDELLVRADRTVQRRLKVAAFREQKTLEDFDWAFNTSVKKKQIYELATCRFIREHRDVLWLGPPGLGKSHLVQALGYQAVKMGFLVLYRSIFDVVRDFLHDEAFGEQEKVMAKYLKPELLIIDDMGMKQLPKRSGEYLFEIILRRYETRSTMMTSNRPLEDWGKLIGDIPAATAILDRFLHHAEIITLTGRSYRLRDQARSLKGQGADESKPAKAPPGSEGAAAESKPAKAPPGSEGAAAESKPAKAPPDQS